MLSFKHTQGSIQAESVIANFAVHGLVQLRCKSISGTGNDNVQMLSTVTMLGPTALEWIMLPCNNIQQLMRDWTDFQCLASLNLECCVIETESSTTVQQFCHSIATAAGLAELVLRVWGYSDVESSFWDSVATLSELPPLVRGERTKRGVLANLSSLSQLSALTLPQLHGCGMPADEALA
jgi:hypothetical protein